MKNKTLVGYTVYDVTVTDFSQLKEAHKDTHKGTRLSFTVIAKNVGTLVDYFEQAYKINSIHVMPVSGDHIRLLEEEPESFEV